MVKAYTLSDKIVQQEYNDFESFVGLVFKLPDGGSPEVSSIDQLQAANASPIPVGQVTTYLVEETLGWNTYTFSQDVLSAGTFIDKVFGDWTQAFFDQWVIVRSFSVEPLYDISLVGSTTFPTALIYKMVVDAYYSPVAP
jgi:hypothetical protein